MDDLNHSQIDGLDINPALLVGLNLSEAKPTPNWNAGDIKFLIENRMNMSMTMIAGHLNKSKGAVAGKLRRLGIKTSKDFHRMMLAVSRGAVGGNLVNKKKADDKWTAIATVYKKGSKAVPQHMREPPVAILDGVGVKLWLLEPHHCKWVVGEPSNLTCCGQNRQKDSPYCQDHHKFAYKGRPNGR